MIVDISYMGQVKVDDMILYLDFAHPDPFPSEPVAVLDLMDITIDRPAMQTRKSWKHLR